MRIHALLPTLLFLLTAAPLAAGGKGEKEQQGITREQADAILTELKTIRELLSRTPPTAPAAAPAAPEAVVKGSLKIGEAAILGSKTAPVTIVEFTDYQCPFCRQFQTTTFEQIRKKYVDTGKVRFISIDFPLDFHPFAQKAAEASHCAGEQGFFWQMRDVLAANAAKLTVDDLETYARSLYVDGTAFKTCLQSNKFQQRVIDDHKKAEALTVSGTPTFLIGDSTPDGVDGVIVVGALPFDAFEAKLKEWVKE